MKTKSALNRGDRLNPPPGSRNYWLLCRLRDCYVDLVNRYVRAGSGKLVIDYGCGNMPYRPLFKEAQYQGADFPGNELAELLLDDQGNIKVNDATADFVVSSQVLEHVADVPHYLSEARRVLKSDGVMFLSTHGVWRYHPDPCDYWRWTCDGLRKTLEDNGFVVSEMRGILGPEATALQILQDAVAPRLSRSLRPLYLWNMQRKIRRADLRCSDDSRNKDACVYVMVAKPKKL